jgi:hypothetical protein
MWPWSTIRQLRDRVEAMKAENERVRQQLQNVRADRNLLVDVNRNLRDELALARKNDNRDPKTGRFVRREADHIDE